jgi:hypothetical protein
MISRIPTPPTPSLKIFYRKSKGAMKEYERTNLCEDLCVFIRVVEETLHATGIVLSS